MSVKWVYNKKTTEVGESLAAMGVILVIGALFILLADKSSIKAYSSLIQGALGTLQSIVSTISKNTPLAFTGLAMIMGSRYGMLNINVEGWLHVGAMAGVIMALILNSLLAPVLLAVNTLEGIFAGMAVDSMPGIFKARFGANEAIATTMLNYICTLFTPYLVNGLYKTEGSAARTELAAEEIWFGKLLPRIQLTVVLFLLLFIAATMYVFLWKTSVGYQLWAMEANPSAAGAAGIRVSLFPIMLMTFNGGITALVGVTEVLGEYHRLVEGSPSSFGFTGIAVAILGRNHPVGVLLTALLFGIIGMGFLRMGRETMVSTNTVTVVQSLVILLVTTPELIRWTRKRG